MFGLAHSFDPYVGLVKFDLCSEDKQEESVGRISQLRYLYIYIFIVSNINR